MWDKSSQVQRTVPPLSASLLEWNPTPLHTFLYKYPPSPPPAPPHYTVCIKSVHQKTTSAKQARRSSGHTSSFRSRDTDGRKGKKQKYEVLLCRGWRDGWRDGWRCFHAEKSEESPAHRTIVLVLEFWTSLLKFCVFIFAVSDVEEKLNKSFGKKRFEREDLKEIGSVFRSKCAQRVSHQGWVTLYKMFSSSRIQNDLSSVTFCSFRTFVLEKTGFSRFLSDYDQTL